MNLQMNVFCCGLFQVRIIKTPAHGIFAYVWTCMTSPEIETTKLSSSLRKITTKLGSLPTLSEANDLVALAYIAVPAFIFLSNAVETLKQTQVQRSRKNVKNVNGP